MFLVHLQSCCKGQKESLIVLTLLETHTLVAMMNAALWAFVQCFGPQLSHVVETRLASVGRSVVAHHFAIRQHVEAIVFLSLKPAKYVTPSCTAVWQKAWVVLQHQLGEVQYVAVASLLSIDA